MSQINVEQVTALLATLGLSSTSGENATLRDAHGNTSAESIQGPLHSFYCYNCAFPNMIPVNAIPMLVAIANHQSNTSQSGNTDSTAPATQTHGNPPALAPTPNNAVPAAVPQSMAAQGAPTASAAGPSVATATAATTTGPDGPWYIVSKGRAVGVFRGWQNVTLLVTGISCTCYFCCPTQAAAQAAFNEAIIGGSVEVLM